MEIKAKFENGCFVPLEKIDNIKDKCKNKEIKIEIIPKIEELVGVLKDLKIDSVSLQHKIKDMW